MNSAAPLIFLEGSFCLALSIVSTKKSIKFTKSNICDITVHFCVRKNNYGFQSNLPCYNKYLSTKKKQKNKQPKQTEKIENDGTVLGTLSNLSDFL